MLRCASVNPEGFGFSSFGGRVSEPTKTDFERCFWGLYTASALHEAFAFALRVRHFSSCGVSLQERLGGKALLEECTVSTDVYQAFSERLSLLSEESLLHATEQERSLLLKSRFSYVNALALLLQMRVQQFLHRQGVSKKPSVPTSERRSPVSSQKEPSPLHALQLLLLQSLREAVEFEGADDRAFCGEEESLNSLDVFMVSKINPLHRILLKGPSPIMQSSFLLRPFSAL